MFEMKLFNRSKQIKDLPADELRKPIATGAPMIRFPFEGDYDNYFFDQAYVVYADYYVESIPAIGDTHFDYNDLFFIEDSGLQDLGGAVVKFTRTYGILPGLNPNQVGAQQSRLECESFVWTKPGISTGDIAFTVFFASTIAVANGFTTLTSTSAHNLTYTFDGNTYTYPMASVHYIVIDPVTKLQQGRDVVVAITIPDAYSIRFANIIDIGAIAYQWFSKPQTTREPVQRVVPSYVYTDYFMPGVNCDSVEEIEIIQPWKILDAFGNETDTISMTTNPPLFTNASGTGYYEMIADRERIVAEASSIRRFKGNIWERSTRHITIV